MAVYLVPTQPGRTIVLDKPVLFVGRHPECDVVLTSSRKVSRKHCCIAQVNQDFYIRDLGSMNGVRVNGQPVQRESRLRLGDEVTIGDVSYRLQTQKTLRPNAAAPSAGRPRSFAPPPLPADLSQDIPIPIPDEEEFASAEEIVSLGEDAILEESGELRDSNSHV